MLRRSTTSTASASRSLSREGRQRRGPDVARKEGSMAPKCGREDPNKRLEPSSAPVPRRRRFDDGEPEPATRYVAGFARRLPDARHQPFLQHAIVTRSAGALSAGSGSTPSPALEHGASLAGDRMKRAEADRGPREPPPSRSPADRIDVDEMSLRGAPPGRKEPRLSAERFVALQRTSWTQVSL